MAFSSSIDQVYLVGAFIMLTALVVTFFLPQISFRKDEHASYWKRG